LPAAAQASRVLCFPVARALCAVVIAAYQLSTINCLGSWVPFSLRDLSAFSDKRQSKLR